MVKPNEHAPSDIPLARPETWACRPMHEVRPNALLTILVDYLFHFPVVVLEPGLKQRNLRTSLFFRKEFEKHKEHDERLRIEGRWHRRPAPIKATAHSASDK